MLYLLICIFYAYWCLTRFPYHMMLVSFNNSNMTGATSETGTAYPS